LTCSLPNEDGIVADSDTSCILVTENQKLLGILTERDLVRLSAQGYSLPEIAVEEVMTTDLITISASELTDFFVPLQQFRQHHIRHLPVVDERGNLQGLITQSSLRQLLRPVHLLRLRHNAETMIKSVICVEPEVALRSVSQLMSAHEISSVVVARGKIPLGIITEGDIVQYQALQLDLAAVTAKTVMSSPLFTLQPKDHLWQTLQLMRDRRISRVIVTDQEGKLAGIITQGDVLNLFNPLGMYEWIETLEQQVEALAAENEKRELQLQDFIDHANDLIQSVALNDGSFQYVNRAWCETLGYSKEEVKQLTVFTLLPTDDAQHCRQIMDDLVQGKRTKVDGVELRLISKAGDTIIVEGNLDCRYEAGKPVATRGIFRNVTARKAAENKLRALNKQLTRTNRLKDEFVANMSHELRSPLNGILLLTESLQAQTYGTLNEKQDQYLETITHSGKHLLALINDILDLSKIEAGKLELELGPVNIEGLCQHSLLFIRERAEKKSITLKTEISALTIPFYGDERRLRQALINLLTNAVKFTPEGGSIMLKVTATGNPSLIGSEVHFAVMDTGIGISEESQALLFQPFTQLDTDLNWEEGGTGLGLSLVRRIAELHGGTATVESQLGKGSTFKISLPYVAPGKRE
jgi:PAS domain S-box-containing protein